VSSESRSSTGGGVLPSPGGASQGAVPRARWAGLWAWLRESAQAHPRLFVWLALAIGMVAILLWASRGQPLLPQQRLVLAAATVGLAGLCTWIIHWEPEL